MREMTPVLVAFALVGIAFISSKLNRLAQPLRLEAAEMGEQLLSDPRLPKAQRTVIRLELDQAFSRFWFLLLAFAMAPFVAAWVASRYKEEEHDLEISEDDLRGRVDEFYEITDRIGSMNHPILYPALKVWLVLVFAVSMPLAALFGRTIAQIKPSYLFAAPSLRRV